MASLGFTIKFFSLFAIISSITVDGLYLEESISGRIVGGETSYEGEFPWQVSLRNSGRHFCGGTLISLQHVLTAAHCVVAQTDLSVLTVITGTNSLASGGETHAVRNITSHTSYVGSSDSYRYDVAVLTLDSEITETDLQKPIALAIEEPPEGAQLVVSGWGRVLYPSSSLPTSLQKLNLTLVNTTECQSFWSLTIYESQICAMQEYGNGVCNGDSGGPLVYNNQVVGIVSWGNPCANGVPDVYTNVYAYLYWIGSIIYNTETSIVSENTLDAIDDDILFG